MPKRVNLTKEQISTICNQYKAKLPTSQIKSNFNISYTPIYSILRKNNIQIRNPSDAHKKYQINENFFEQIDSEEKAYIFGFICADGTISYKKMAIRIRLSIRDKEILEKIKNAIGYTGPFYYYKSQYFDKSKLYKCKPTIELALSNKKICNNLKKLNLPENKTEYLTFPEIDKKLINHFIRGYFCGDGCVYWNPNAKKSCVCICGAIQFLTELASFIKKQLHISSSIRKRHQESSSNSRMLIISGNLQVKTFINYIYKDATIYLKRKFDKKEQILKNLSLLKPFRKINTKYWNKVQSF